ncbi:MAG: hypothetical protein NVSMB66_0370 [Candidatus Doudnabacteria bacterium]
MVTNKGNAWHQGWLNLNLGTGTPYYTTRRKTRAWWCNCSENDKGHLTVRWLSPKTDSLEYNLVFEGISQKALPTTAHGVPVTAVHPLINSKQWRDGWNQDEVILIPTVDLVSHDEPWQEAETLVVQKATNPPASATKQKVTEPNPSEEEERVVEVEVPSVVETPEETTPAVQVENLYFDRISCTAREDATVCKMYVTNQGGDAHLEIKNSESYGSTRVITETGTQSEAVSLPSYEVAHLARKAIVIDFPAMPASIHSFRSVQFALTDKELQAQGEEDSHLYSRVGMHVNFENVAIRR